MTSRRRRLFLPFLAALSLAGAASYAPLATPQPNLSGTIAGLPTEIDPGGPVTVTTMRTLQINATGEFALVAYTQRTDNGPVLNKAGWIFLANDRLINYKMGMISLLRDALADPSRPLGIQLVPGTENASRPVIASVAIGPKQN